MNDRMAFTLRKHFDKVLSNDLVQIDCYNKSVVTTGVSVTITTRINACNHYWILEVDE